MGVLSVGEFGCLLGVYVIVMDVFEMGVLALSDEQVLHFVCLF